MKKVLCSLLLVVIGVAASAQTAVVTRNVNLRPDASTNSKPIELLKPPAGKRSAGCLAFCSC